MLGAAQYHTIPLPKGWPRRVRSAVIHVMSLTQFSLITTRSWAANSWNVRLRLKCENERLRQELALFREEIGVTPLQWTSVGLGSKRWTDVSFRS
jgi:hypothetical protein